jgi:hypothetical protein
LFENGFLRRYLVIRRIKKQRGGENFIVESLLKCTSYLAMIGDQINEANLAGCVAYRGRGDMHTGLWFGNLKERDHLEYLGVGGRIGK